MVSGSVNLLTAQDNSVKKKLQCQLSHLITEATEGQRNELTFQGCNTLFRVRRNNRSHLVCLCVFFFRENKKLKILELLTLLQLPRARSLTALIRVNKGASGLGFCWIHVLENVIRTWSLSISWVHFLPSTLPSCLDPPQSGQNSPGLTSYQFNDL